MVRSDSVAEQLLLQDEYMSILGGGLWSDEACLSGALLCRQVYASVRALCRQ